MRTLPDSTAYAPEFASLLRALQVHSKAWMTEPDMGGGFSLDIPGVPHLFIWAWCERDGMICDWRVWAAPFYTVNTTDQVETGFHADAWSDPALHATLAQAIHSAALQLIDELVG